MNQSYGERQGTAAQSPQEVTLPVIAGALLNELAMVKERICQVSNTLGVPSQPECNEKEMQRVGLMGILQTCGTMVMSITREVAAIEKIMGRN